MKNILFTFLLLGFQIISSAQFINEPEVDDQNRVTFTVNAPNAKEVKVVNLSDEEAMGAAEYSLTKGENGI